MTSPYRIPVPDENGRFKDKHLPERLSGPSLDATYLRSGSITERPVGQVLNRAVSIGSSTMAGLATHLTDLLAPRGASHLISYARGSWQISHTASVVGTRPIAVSTTLIPESGPVTLSPINMPESNNSTVYYHLPCLLAGVRGVLASSAGSPDWVFTRSESGSPVSVPEGSQVIPTPLQGRERDIVFFNPGKNSITQYKPDWDITRIINMSETMAETLGVADGRVLFIGHFVNGQTTSGSSVRTRIQQFNEYFAKKYGNRFFDLSGYVTGSQIWTDTGITPTQEDLDEQALGNKPPSVSNDTGHFNAVGYAAVAGRLMERVDLLGWVPPPPPPQWTVQATDSFDRPDGPMGTTETGEKVWGLIEGYSTEARILDGAPSQPPSNSSVFAVFDPEVADYRVGAVFETLGETTATRNVRLIVRAVDFQNFYFLSPRMSASSRGTALWKMQDNNLTVLGTSPVEAQNGDRLDIEVDGSTLRALLNGEELFTRTDSTFPLPGVCGIYLATGSQTTGTRFGSFEFAVKG